MNNCFAQYASIEQVIVYGSRAIGNYRNGSDIDLTIVGEATYSDLLKLENELNDLLLPYKIDLSLLHQIANKDSIAHIEQVGKVFYEKTKNLFSANQLLHIKLSEKAHKQSEIVSAFLKPSYNGAAQPFHKITVISPK